MNKTRTRAGCGIAAVLVVAACSRGAGPAPEPTGQTQSAIRTGILFAHYPSYITASGDTPSWNGAYGDDLLKFHAGPADFVAKLKNCKDKNYYNYCADLGLEIALFPEYEDQFTDGRYGSVRLMGERGWRRFFGEANSIGEFFTHNNVKIATVRTTLNKIKRDKDTWAESSNKYQQFVVGNRTDTFAHIRDAITSAAEANKAPLVLRLAKDKATFGEINAVVARTKTEMDALATVYGDVLRRFVTYKSTEADTGRRIADLAVRASAADIAELAKVRADLAALARADGDAQGTIAVDALRVDAAYRAAKTNYETKIGPYYEFLWKKGKDQFMVLSIDAVRAREISSYCSIRERNRNEAIAKVYEGSRRRLEGLIAASASEAARKDLAKARLLEASTKFLEEVTAQAAAAWQAPPEVGSQKFPLLAGKYDAMLAFTTMAPLCAASGSPVVEWMGAGCEALNREVSKARVYLKASLPALIRFEATRLQAAGVSADAISAMNGQLAAGDIRAAVLTHDVAAMLADGEGAQ